MPALIRAPKGPKKAVNLSIDSELLRQAAR
jgi:hypothetical protein